MKVAVIGTRGCPIGDLKKLLPEDTTELTAGYVNCVDIFVCRYAVVHGLDFKRIMPEFEKPKNYREVAGFIHSIIDDADKVLIFWDGSSRKTGAVIRECLSLKKDFVVHTIFKKS